MPISARTRNLWIGLALGAVLFLVGWLVMRDVTDGPLRPRSSPPTSSTAQSSPLLEGSGAAPSPLVVARVDSSDTSLHVHVREHDGSKAVDPGAYLVSAIEPYDNDGTRLVVGPDGSFVLREQQMRGRVLIARAQGAVPVQVLWDELLERASDFQVEVRLGQGLQLRGRVVDVWGKPVAQAGVRVYGRHGHDVELLASSTALLGSRLVGDFHEVHTDAEGYFVVDGVRELPVSLLPHKDGYIRDIGSPPVRVGAGEDREIELVLMPQLRLGIQLVDDLTGKPVSAASTRFQFPKGVVTSPQPLSYGASPGCPADGMHPESATRWRTLRIGAGYEGVPGDEIRVQVTAEAPFYELRTKVLTLSPASHPTRQVIAMRRVPTFPGLSSLQIKCTSSIGLARWSIRIQLRPLDRTRGGGFHATLNLDEAGQGELALPAGEYVVHVLPTLAGPWWGSGRSAGRSAGQRVVVPEREPGRMTHDMGGGLAEIPFKVGVLPYFELTLLRQEGRRLVPHLTTSSLVIRFGPGMSAYRRAFPLSKEKLVLPLRSGTYIAVLKRADGAVEQAMFEISDGKTVRVEFKPR